jgi:hypothetical protein
MRRLFALWEGGHVARRGWQPGVIRYSHLLSESPRPLYNSDADSVLVYWEGGHAARRGLDSRLQGGRACCPPRTPCSILAYWEGGHAARRGRQHAVPPKSVHGLRTTPFAVLPSISNTTSRQYGSESRLTSWTTSGPFSAIFHETTGTGERHIRIEPL